MSMHGRDSSLDAGISRRDSRQTARDEHILAQQQQQQHQLEAMQLAQRDSHERQRLVRSASQQHPEHSHSRRPSSRAPPREGHGVPVPPPSSDVYNPRQSTVKSMHSRNPSARVPVPRWDDPNSQPPPERSPSQHHPHSPHSPMGAGPPVPAPLSSRSSRRPPKTAPRSRHRGDVASGTEDQGYLSQQSLSRRRGPPPPITQSTSSRPSTTRVLLPGELTDSHRRGHSTVRKEHMMVNPILRPTRFFPQSPTLRQVRADLRFPTCIANHRREAEEPATNPGVREMFLVSEEFPWVITVRNPNYITVGDVMATLYNALNQQISDLDWYNRAESWKRDQIKRTFSAARRDHPHLRRRDDIPKQIDWCGDKTIFGGIFNNDSIIAARIGNRDDWKRTWVVQLVPFEALIENLRGAERWGAFSESS
ncbi:hypothetical protein BOTBODRAFT_55927 [Botryobasidium botryosum FD-172 SS1]|uniref:DUF6699 domain-containing protein n=1 Tax=Botryobasidium botryosum (strain FD-172 SS1) TaxID=930990 RepID=A0A067MD50_BOTB1|nr:hypothetical protein BOTBODRAFT_55927 [Botryobasidium botryosum FD-172 SS1]